MLQPIHSRISSNLPSSIFFGRKGSAIDGRAAPIKSTIPSLICANIVSGDVKRPTVTTGLDVSFLIPLTYGVNAASLVKRDKPISRE